MSWRRDDHWMQGDEVMARELRRAGAWVVVLGIFLLLCLMSGFAMWDSYHAPIRHPKNFVR